MLDFHGTLSSQKAFALPGPLFGAALFWWGWQLCWGSGLSVFELEQSKADISEWRNGKLYAMLKLRASWRPEHHELLFGLDESPKVIENCLPSCSLLFYRLFALGIKRRTHSGGCI